MQFLFIYIYFSTAEEIHQFLYLLSGNTGELINKCTVAGVLSTCYERMRVLNAFPQQEVIRKDWMFKLVGKETFTVGGANTKATINIEAISGFAYEYTLEVDGKSLQKFVSDRAKTTKTWLLKVGAEDYRVILGISQWLALDLCLSYL